MDKYDYLESGTTLRYQYWINKSSEYFCHEAIFNGEHHYGETNLIWYDEIFPNIEKPHVIYGWGHGPCFSVSKELIRRHPISVYVNLLNKFHPETPTWS